MAHKRALAFSKAAARANQCVRRSQHGKTPVQRGNGLLACGVISRLLCSDAQRNSSPRRICMAWPLECVVRPAIVLPTSDPTIKACGQRLHCLSLTTPSTISFHVLALRISHGMSLLQGMDFAQGVDLGFGVAEVAANPPEACCLLVVCHTFAQPSHPLDLGPVYPAASASAAFPQAQGNRREQGEQNARPFSSTHPEAASSRDAIAWWQSPSSSCISRT